MKLHASDWYLGFLFLSFLLSLFIHLVRAGSVYRYVSFPHRVPTARNDRLCLRLVHTRAGARKRSPDVCCISMCRAVAFQSADSEPNKTNKIYSEIGTRSLIAADICMCYTRGQGVVFGASRCLMFVHYRLSGAFFFVCFDFFLLLGHARMEFMLFMKYAGVTAAVMVYNRRFIDSDVVAGLWRFNDLYDKYKRVFSCASLYTIANGFEYEFARLNTRRRKSISDRGNIYLTHWEVVFSYCDGEIYSLLDLLQKE